MKTVTRWTPVFVALATVLTLAACGGGGGGGVITPPVAVLSIIASPPVLPSINGATGVGTAVTTAMSVEFAPLNLANPTAATFSTSTGAGATFTCGGVSVGNVVVPGFSIAQVVGTTKFVATSSFSVAGLPASSNCIFSLPLTIAGGGVVSNPVTISFSFTTAQAQAAWWPPTFVSQGVAIFLDAANATAGSVVNALYPGQTQTGLLPAACKITGDDCWKEAVRNGTIKFATTVAKNANQPTRPIAFSTYKTISTILFPGKTVYCTKPFFADDGTLVNQNDPVENNCSSDEAIYFVTNNSGGILKEKNGQTGISACYQKSNSAQAGGWITTTSTCPQ